jgi:hypothetical protein
VRRRSEAKFAGSTNGSGNAASLLGRFTLAVLSALCAAMLLSASASAAAPTSGGSFNGSATPDGSMSPQRLATDEATGDVYVLDLAHSLVNKFSSSGAYIRQFKGSDTDGGAPFVFAGESDVAVDNSGGPNQGNVYIVTEGGECASPCRIFAFNAAGEFLWEKTLSSDPCGVAVDASGNLYTADYTNGVQKRSTIDGAAIGSPQPITGNSCTMAFDTTGALYLRNWDSGKIFKYATLASVPTEFDPGINPDIATDSSSNDVYLNHGEVEVSVRSSAGVAGTSFDSFMVSGVGVDGAHGRIFVSKLLESKVNIWNRTGGAAPKPTARTEGASTITVHTATISGKSNPEGTATTCKVEYGTTTALGSEQTCTAGVGSGASEAAVSANLTGLAGATTYYYRLTATSANGTIKGAQRTFTTLTPPNHKLTVATSGSGTVTSTPAGISCGATCFANFVEGSEVELTATPQPHSSFSGWSEGCSGTGTCKVTIPGNDSTKVTATFAPITRTVQAAVEGAGKVTATTGAISGCTAGGGTCSGSYDENSEVVLNASPDAHQKFVSWSGCSSTEGSKCKLTVPAANAKVTAKFAPIMRKLTVSKAGSGSGSVSCNDGACAAEYEDGSKVTLAVSAASGSTFAGWSGGDCLGTGGCTITLEADTSVTATFNANPIVEPPPPTCPTNPALCPVKPKPPVKCKKGFKKKRVKGKVKCVRVKKHQARHHKGTRP